MRTLVLPWTHWFTCKYFDGKMHNLHSAHISALFFSPFFFQYTNVVCLCRTELGKKAFQFSYWNHLQNDLKWSCIPLGNWTKRSHHLASVSALVSNYVIPLGCVFCCWFVVCFMPLSWPGRSWKRVFKSQWVTFFLVKQMIHTCIRCSDVMF